MKAYFNWSTGKDSAMALHEALQDSSVEVGKLLTTVNGHYDRVSMHGLRKSLLVKQACAIGLPLDILELPEQPSMDEYTKLMEEKVKQLQSEGYSQAIFGDIFLEDLKEYREEQLAEAGVDCVFPIWKRSTKELMRHFIDSGFQAITVAVNGNLLEEEFCGRILDDDFLKDLPDNVDPCGENGEFHTFCFDGPIFSNPIDYEMGEVEHRTYPNPEDKNQKHEFSFQDLI